MKVLVISHSQELAQAIASVLKVRWPNVSLVQVNEAGKSLELIHGEQPDIVIFHLPEPGEGPPSLDCFDLISQMRGFSDVPLIVISQSHDVMDEVQALEMGADDWVSASFVPMEFIAKVNALLRRCSPNKRGVSSFLGGRLSIDYAACRVHISGKPVGLTPIQYRIFCYLAENEGRVCPSTELLRHVWGPHHGDDKELLKLNVYRLRSKIEEDPSNPDIISNERGMGYVMRASGSSG